MEAKQAGGFVLETFHRRWVICTKSILLTKGENIMMYVLVRLTVEDLAKWKPVFEEAGALRENFGSKGVRA